MKRKHPELPDRYDAFLQELKERIRSAQVRTALSVNRELVWLYLCNRSLHNCPGDTMYGFLKWSRSHGRDLTEYVRRRELTACKDGQTASLLRLAGVTVCGILRVSHSATCFGSNRTAAPMRKEGMTLAAAIL